NGSEVAFFKITSITNGTLFKNDGTTPISNNQFITFAEGNAGLKFTPTANFNGNGSFQVQGSIDNAGTGLSSGFATATITVGSVGDPPVVTNATTNEDTQTSSGLMITKNAADGVDITVFKITNIQNGTLFQNDGTTSINNNDFITFAQGNAGLKFAPTAGLSSPGNSFSFDVQASTSNLNGGLGGSVVTEGILVSCSDPQVVTSTLDDG